MWISLCNEARSLPRILGEVSSALTTTAEKWRIHSKFAVICGYGHAAHRFVNNKWRLSFSVTIYAVREFRRRYVGIHSLKDGRVCCYPDVINPVTSSWPSTHDGKCPNLGSLQIAHHNSHHFGFRNWGGWFFASELWSALKNFLLGAGNGFLRWVWGMIE